MLAAVQQRDLRRTRHRATDAEPSGVAEGIEHGGTRRQPRDAGAVFALVEEPAGLLAAKQIDREAAAILLDHGAGGIAVQQRGRLGQALECAHGAVVAGDDAARGD